MDDEIYRLATGVLVLAKIAAARYRIDKESEEILTAQAELIRLELKSTSPDYGEVRETASQINRFLKQIQK